MSHIKVLLLAGGASSEREVSFESAKQISAQLNKDKYSVKVLELPKDKKNTGWIKEISDNPPDIVFSALHGGNGENGAVQGLLNCMNIPYVGSKVLASAVCMDKNMSKVLMRANYIPVADDVFMKKDELYIDRREKISMLGFPLIVKPNRGGSSIGITISENEAGLISAIDAVRALDDDILIEKHILGQEVSCGVVETEKGVLQVLSVLDIKTNKQFYDYGAKYIDEDTNIDFSTLPEFLQVMIQEVAKKVFRIFECEGYGRVDMIVYEEQLFVLEINTLPGLTSHSLIPKSIESINISFADFLDRQIELELTKQS